MPISDFYIGDTKTLNFDVRRESDQSALDISGWDIYITFKASVDDEDGDAILQKVITMPNDTESQNGRGIGILTSDDTNQFLESGNYFYDIQRVINTNPPDVVTLEYGRVRVTQGVTRVDAPHAYVPDITDVPQASGETVLTNTGFVVGTVTSEDSTTITTTGNITRTEPAEGTYQPVGSTINIFIAN